MTVKILLVDDHQIMREGLRALLEKESDLEVVAEASNGREALDLVQRDPPNIVVMDIGMPKLNGIETARIVTSDHPDINVVALSTHADKRYVVSMLQAGAVAYVLKDAAAAELVQAIRTTLRGRKYLSPQIASTVIDSFLNGESPDTEKPAAELGAREREVLQLLAEGMTSCEIASQLHISTSTVETHRRNIMKKLSLHSVAELTKYAIREGISSL